jgi:hypothetical protein
LGTTTGFTSLSPLRSHDLLHTNTTNSPITTANDVVAITTAESDTDPPSDIPCANSSVRTNSESPIVSSPIRNLTSNQKTQKLFVPIKFRIPHRIQSESPSYSGNGFAKEQACVALKALTFSKENAKTISRSGVSSLFEIFV